MEFNATFLATIISFIIFVFLMNKILYTPILNIIEERKNYIDGNYKSAKEDNEQTSLIDSEIENKRNVAKDDARIQYSKTIEEFKTQKAQLVQEARQAAKNELEESNLELTNISNEAKEKFMNAFKDFSYSEVLSVGEAVGNIPCYNFQTEVKGDILYAQISKVNGQLITFSYAGSCKSVEIDSDDAIEKAMDFMANVGITNMKPVWVNLSNNVYTINFASVKDDVIIYSDLIKVRVCAETAMVIGFEATTYYTNHHERSLSISAISLSQAKNKVSKNIEIDTSRLVIVPIGKESEKLCYEFSGVYEGSTYYVYIDAVTGRQVEMFKVIDGTEGTLLM